MGSSSVIASVYRQEERRRADLSSRCSSPVPGRSTRQPSSCLSKVKNSPLIVALSALYNDQDLSRLRFAKPAPFIFLCGGVIASNPAEKRLISLRDYLYRIKIFESRIKGNVILAERATQLYRETQYGDLISFEEDIARIASLVLVIPESPGSLAELGASATDDTIRHALRVIMQDKYENDESFIRRGPIERLIKKHDRDHVGFYPWRINNSQHIVLRSISPHYKVIVKFVNDHIGKLPTSTYFPSNSSLRLFYVIYWVIYLFVAASPTVLHDSVIDLLPGTTREDIRNKIYCMMLAGWVKKVPYSGKDYYYVTDADDPFKYSYSRTAMERDTLRRKTDIAASLKKIEDIPKPVLTQAVEGRRARLP